MSSTEAPTRDKSAAEGDKVVTLGDEDNYESAPDDLADFMVVDEAEITEPEDEDFEVRSVATSDEEEESNREDCALYRRAPRTYTEKDFHPTTPDPRCKRGWLLAAYWPVYVGNFRIPKKTDSEQSCLFAVHRYFASKGLPSFMMFRLKDNFYVEYQKRVGIFDMLVYFCTQQDANRAVKLCNRELYYGHRLQVADGRTPDLFNKKSWRLRHVKAEDKLEIVDNIEQYVERYGEVKCLVKHDLNAVLVQFGKATAHVDGKELWDFSGDPRIDAVPIVGPVPKQRFLEQDVTAKITQEINADPQFMRNRAPHRMLQSIKRGVIPQIGHKWAKFGAAARRAKRGILPELAGPSENLSNDRDNRVQRQKPKKSFRGTRVRYTDRLQRKVDNFRQQVLGHTNLKAEIPASDQQSVANFKKKVVDELEQIRAMGRRHRRMKAREEGFKQGS